MIALSYVDLYNNFTMLIGNDLFNQTRRRFKHIEDTAQERQLVESKQRKYKKILDDQINEKRKM